MHLETIDSSVSIIKNIECLVFLFLPEKLELKDNVRLEVSSDDEDYMGDHYFSDEENDHEPIYQPADEEMNEEFHDEL